MNNRVYNDTYINTMLGYNKEKNLVGQRRWLSHAGGNGDGEITRFSMESDYLFITGFNELRIMLKRIVWT